MTDIKAINTNDLRIFADKLAIESDQQYLYAVASELDDTRTERNLARSALSATEARAEAAEERVRELEAALKPFAALADQMSNWTGGTQVNITMYHVGAPTVIRHAFCVRDVNAAARALKGAPDGR